MCLCLPIAKRDDDELASAGATEQAARCQANQHRASSKKGPSIEDSQYMIRLLAVP